MYLRSQLVDDLETEVTPEMRLVRLVRCPISDKINIRDLIQNQFPFNLSFCYSVIYLANFHYKSGPHMNKKVIDICENVISVGNLTMINYVHVEKFSFPVLLSSNVIRIFDEDIKSAFGFLALFKKVRSIGGEAVLAACSIMFAHYLKSRYIVGVLIQLVPCSKLIFIKFKLVPCFPKESISG